MCNTLGGLYSRALASLSYLRCAMLCIGVNALAVYTDMMALSARAPCVITSSAACVVPLQLLMWRVTRKQTAKGAHFRHTVAEELSTARVFEHGVSNAGLAYPTLLDPLLGVEAEGTLLPTTPLSRRRMSSRGLRSGLSQQSAIATTPAATLRWK